MKRLALTLLLLLPVALHAQSDSAAMRIVDRYLALLAADALPRDSMLVINTTVSSPGSADTFTMRRLYAWPQMFRVDIFRADGSRQTGYCTNGDDRYRTYDSVSGWWRDMHKDVFHINMASYDFRGPLYNWRTQGVDLYYQGKVAVKGEQLDVVKASGPFIYTRLYMFEQSGMLALIIEQNDVEGEEQEHNDTHIDWKCFHEFQSLHGALLPTLESFARGGRLTVLHSEAHLEKRDNLQFNRD